jgi:hypothetical protein
MLRSPNISVTGLRGAENQAFLDFAGKQIRGHPDRNPRKHQCWAKLSAVRFLEVPVCRDQITRFRTTGMRVVIGFDHSDSADMTVLPEPVRAAQPEDFD